MPLWKALESGKKRLIEVAHRRWGKDDVALHWTACAALQRVGNYWHMLPEAEQARKAIWRAVNAHTGKRRIDEAFPLVIRNKTLENEMFIEFVNGSTFQVVGSDNYNAYMGSSPIGVTFSEYALGDPAAWGYIRPILLENGGWASFITTPRGSNHAKALYDLALANPKEWFAELSPADKTGVFTSSQLEHEKAEYVSQYGEDLGKAVFDQEYLCSFSAATLGAFYASALDKMEREGRLANVPYDSGLQVYTGWDLGKRDQTAIWFAQVVGKEIRLIDYYVAAGHELDHYAKILHEKPYAYAEHYLPHDVSHELLGMPKTRAEQLESLGVSVTPGEARSVEDGIAAVRRMLGQCWIDRTKCARGVEALRNYRQKWDERLKSFGGIVHDWSSHGADALRELAVNIDNRPTPNWAAPVSSRWIV